MQKGIMPLIIFICLCYACNTQHEQKNEISQKEGEGHYVDTTANLSRYELASNAICTQTQLSKQFNLTVEFKRYALIGGNHDSCSVTVFVKDKDSGDVRDSIVVESHFYYTAVTFECDSMVSYSTKYNTDMWVADNFYGDIVVADLNFDNKDDIAIINDIGGNGGTFYSYFLQTANGFILDSYLTDSMVYFPTELNKSKKELVTIVFAGACCTVKHTYKYSKAKSEWKESSKEWRCSC